MASPAPPPEVSGLKYLGFVEIVVDTATKYAVSVYEFAKDSSGPLKPGVDSVENTVRTVVGPVYQKIEGKPYEILLFVDKQVNSAVGALDGAVPQTVKDKSYQAYGVARQVPDAARAVVSDLQTNGLVGTAKSYYATYEPVAEQWTYAAWKQLLKLPYAPQAVHFAAPTTLFCAEKFNQVLVNLKNRQVPLSAYIPTFPVEKLEKCVNMDTS